ncbi:TetR/AcrR family transcriptional regulator [Allorhizocola rhizosphaerae]|uniref:TetR/AcrR family transcriptional regulator n=1 Tax=Allorhizocola rhizosphaerae TaxID=1872709 RepID=UPI000E3BC97B|nr:TetR/AcrR family transcriptional regulator [Allorhizocola rhizosphaerae]
MPTRTMDKRDRLIHAAVRVVHEQGFGRTTLADIAATADVPLGNVYYYFKTKDALGAALVAEHAAHQEALQARWDEDPDPRARLKAFVRMTDGNRESLANFGCPIGTLCAELAKAGGPVADQASAIFTGLLAWLEVQFQALGCGADSRGLAIHLLSALQGVSLLAHSLNDPAYVTREAERLVAWLETLGAGEESRDR